MSVLENLSAITLSIADRERKLAIAQAEQYDARNNYTAWKTQSLESCSGKVGAKKDACISDKQYKEQRAIYWQNVFVEKQALVKSLVSEIASLKLEQESNKEAQVAINTQTVTLAGQGLTYKAVETEADAQAQATILKTKQEVEAAAAADQKALEQKANRNRLFLIFGIFLFLVIMILIIRKLRKTKTANA
jgi:hypothetical protein